MDVLYRRGRATAREVMSEIGGKQAYSTVRTQLRVLEHKGYVRHEPVGRVYVYTPVVPANTAQRVALQRVGNSAAGASRRRQEAARVARRAHYPPKKDRGVADCGRVLASIARLSEMCHNVHMKTISIRELHLKTGRWVRHAASRGPIVVTIAVAASRRFTHLTPP